MARTPSSGRARATDPAARATSSRTRTAGPTCWAGKCGHVNVTHSIVGTRSQASLFSTLSSGIVSSLVCRYLNEDFILKLPSEKKIRDLKWFSVYDLSTQVINCSVTSCILITYCIVTFIHRQTLGTSTSARVSSPRVTRR